MSKGLVAKNSITIKASVDEVWQALITPELIKKYLFGTDAISDFKVGSTITYKGVWEGREYEDKGEILHMVPGKLFQSTYFSALSGKEDRPENYNTVTFELESEGNFTKVIVTQDNIGSKEEVEHMNKNWQMVLESMRKTLENK